MKCKNCIAFGRDHISRLCVAGHSLLTFKDGYGCKYGKKSIEKHLKRELEEKPNRYTLFNSGWSEEE